VLWLHRKHAVLQLLLPERLLQLQQPVALLLVLPQLLPRVFAAPAIITIIPIFVITLSLLLFWLFIESALPAPGSDAFLVLLLLLLVQGGRSLSHCCQHRVKWVAAAKQEQDTKDVASARAAAWELEWATDITTLRLAA
jgi:hypothetical protein